jgi:hypothetical protein
MDIGERVSIFNVVQNSTHFLRSFLTGKQEKEDPRNTFFFFFFLFSYKENTILFNPNYVLHCLKKHDSVGSGLR